MDPETNSTAPVHDDSETDLLLQYSREFKSLQERGASEGELAPVIDNINRHVAELVDEGEMAPEDAWAVSVGDNPYIDAMFNRRDI